MTLSTPFGKHFVGKTMTSFHCFWINIAPKYANFHKDRFNSFHVMVGGGGKGDTRRKQQYQWLNGSTRRPQWSKRRSCLNITSCSHIISKTCLGAQGLYVLRHTKHRYCVGGRIVLCICLFVDTWCNMYEADAPL